MRGKISLLLLVLLLLPLATSAHGIERTAEIIGSRVMLHEAPDGDSNAITTINRGFVVDVIGRSDKASAVGNFTDYWYRVRYRGKTGWVFGQFLYLKTNKRGGAHIFTLDELIPYCDSKLNTLRSLRSENLSEPLIEIADAFLHDLEDLSRDTITSSYITELRGYHAAALYYLAVGYIGVGDIKKAREIKEQFLLSYSDLTFSDGKSAAEFASEIERLIENRGASSP
jgi:hypothetical protein